MSGHRPRGLSPDPGNVTSCERAKTWRGILLTGLLVAGKILLPAAAHGLGGGPWMALPAVVAVARHEPAPRESNAAASAVASGAQAVKEETAEDAQAGKPVDLTALDLEELAQLSVIRIDVTGAHIHRRGEWMVGLRTGLAEMEGNLDGDERRSTADVLRLFPVSPTAMTMRSSMLEVMYGVTDKVTLMLMAPYLRKSMDHVTRAGGRFRTTSEGIGDVEARLHIGAWRRQDHWLIVEGGLRFPTGTVSARDRTPAGPGQLLPYPMQLGTGSLGLTSGLSYIYQGPVWSAGGQGMWEASLETNDQGYEVGDRFDLGIWGMRSWGRSLAVSARATNRSWQRYLGADGRLDPTVAPTADPHLRSGSIAEVAMGIHLYTAGHRVELEGAVPLHQSLNGPQLALRRRLRLSWQWTF